MATINGVRSRTARMSTLGVQPGVRARLLDVLTGPAFLSRAAAALGVALLLSILTSSWSPQFPYRRGQTLERDYLSRFPIADKDRTNEERIKARQRVRYVYRHDPEVITQVRLGLENLVVDLAAFTNIAENPRWRELATADAGATDEQAQGKAATFINLVRDETRRKDFFAAVEKGMADITRTGLLERLEQDPDSGDQGFIEVRRVNENVGAEVSVASVRLLDAKQPDSKLRQSLLRELSAAQFTDPVAGEVAWKWIIEHLKPSLQLDFLATEEAASRAEKAVKPVMFPEGHVLAPGRTPLGPLHLERMKQDHELAAASRGGLHRGLRWVSVMGMYAATYSISGYFIYRQLRRLLASWRQYGLLLGLFGVTVFMAYICSIDSARAELVPIMLFAMISAMAYGREAALLLTACTVLVTTFTIGQGLATLVVMMSGACTAILLTGKVRKRTKLISVGLWSALVTSLTTLGVETMTSASLALSVCQDAVWFGGWAVFACALMSVLLPLVEWAFGILTDLRLLELGDASHPLLQELVRRAPGTYNHSINVASLAEAAADKIGARGLLVRVGAYFHDIGKMLKPEYFVENQAQGPNQHSALLPAMSKLIIVAHVKDGAELARKHGIPRPIVDFIEQHHGTTLVEYFYRLASEQNRSAGKDGECREEEFRYVGPKPQSKEAAVLMLADVAEGACRSLVEPTAARIENLINDLATKRLLDGQFDECDLTLRELHLISDSLIKSLLSMYHGRIKYPERQSA